MVHQVLMRRTRHCVLIGHYHALLLPKISPNPSPPYPIPFLIDYFNLRYSLTSRYDLSPPIPSSTSCSLLYNGGIIYNFIVLILFTIYLQFHCAYFIHHLFFMLSCLFNVCLFGLLLILHSIITFYLFILLFYCF